MKIAYYEENNYHTEILGTFIEIFKNNNHAIGKNNSQYGTIWITNELSNKKISKNVEIPSGWRRGRILKLGK
jgi:hypothetical protein